MTGTLESEMANGSQITAKEREREDNQFWEQLGKKQTDIPDGPKQI